MARRRLIEFNSLYQDYDLPINEFIDRQRALIGDLWQPEFIVVAAEHHRTVVEQALTEGFRISFAAVRSYQALREKFADLID